MIAEDILPHVILVLFLLIFLQIFLINREYNSMTPEERGDLRDEYEGVEGEGSEGSKDIRGDKRNSGKIRGSGGTSDDIHANDVSSDNTSRQGKGNSARRRKGKASGKKSKE